MVVTVMETSFERLKPRVINYSINLSKTNYFEKIYELSKTTLEGNADRFQEFTETCQKAPNPTKVCMGQSFFIYEQNSFKSNNA